MSKVIDFRVTNAAYARCFQDSSPVMLMYGGAGSGKSFAAAQKLVLRLLTVPGHSMIVLRKHKETLAVSVFDELWKVIGFMGLRMYFERFNSGPRRIVCTTNESRAIFMGMNDREDLKSLAKVTSAWVEEATQIEPEDFDQLRLRMRGENPEYFQTILTFNPSSSTHWIYERWFSAALEHEERYSSLRSVSTIYKGTYLDNPHSGPEYADQMANLREANPVFFNAYALGEWSDQTSLVYEPFTRHDTTPAGGEVWYGLDFGYNDPLAFVEVRKADGRLYVRELVYERGLLNVTFAQKMSSLGVPKSGYIYADSAAKDRIEDLRRLGWNVWPANKQRKAGVDFVKSLTANLSIQRTSLNLLSEAQAYSWKTDREGHLLDDPQDGNDHALDALRYALYTHLAKRKERRLWLH